MPLEPLKAFSRPQPQYWIKRFGPMGARFVSSAGLGSGNLVGRDNSPQHPRWIKIGLPMFLQVGISRLGRMGLGACAASCLKDPAVLKILRVVNLQRVVNLLSHCDLLSRRTLCGHHFAGNYRHVSFQGRVRGVVNMGGVVTTLRRSNSLFFALVVVFLVRKGPLGGPGRIPGSCLNPQAPSPSKSSNWTRARDESR